METGFVSLLSPGPQWVAGAKLEDQEGYAALLKWWIGLRQAGIGGLLGILLKTRESIVLKWLVSSRDEVERRLAECPMIALETMTARTAPEPTSPAP